MKLYQITEQYRNIAELLENPDFEGNEDIASALDQVQDTFDQKAVQVVYGIKNAESDIAAIDCEIKRLQEMKKVRKNRIEEVKSYLKRNMQATDTHKISCPYFTITYSERAESAVEIDEDFEQYIHDWDVDCYSVEIKPDKTEIKRRLKQGQHIPGAKLKDSQVLKIS